MPRNDSTPLRIPGPGHALRLADFPTEPPGAAHGGEDAWREQLPPLGAKLNDLQGTLHAGKSRALLLVLQGMDASGKDGVIRSVFSHVSPLGVRAEAFGVPTALEARHDFLWRVHARTPARGEMVIFNRSHYEDVVVTRVHGSIDHAECERRLGHIRAFESLLIDAGVTVLKCFLHISRAEQKRRLQSRLDDPGKRWKLQESDFADRRRWGDFVDAWEHAMTATHTADCPWHVVPADSKPWRDLVVAQLLVKALERMNLKTPPASFDVASVRLE